MIKNNYKAHLALAGANIIYGANYIIAKGIMPHKIGPSAFILLRVIGAGILFWFIRSFIKEKVAKKDFLMLILCGVFGVAANQLLFFHGLNLTSPIDASIILTATPVLVMVFSFFILKERINALKMWGIAVGALGALLLIWYGQHASGTSSALGNLFVFLNACSYALYLVLAKTLMKKYKAITVISWIFLFGFILIFPITIGDLLSTNFEAFTLNTYLTIAYVVIGTTFLAYLFNIFALSQVAPTVASSYIYTQPAISFIMVAIYAYALNQEKYAQDINLIKILSCLLVFVGVYLVSKKPKNSLV